MQKNKRSARELALNILYQVDIGGLPVEDALRVALGQSSLDENAKQFAELLVRGTLEATPGIDKKLRILAPDWPPERQGSVDRNILRLSLFEIEKVESVPDVVSVNEAVEMAKKFGSADSGKFINGVLAGYLRQCEKKLQSDKSDLSDTSDNQE